MPSVNSAPPGLHRWGPYPYNNLEGGPYNNLEGAPTPTIIYFRGPYPYYYKGKGKGKGPQTDHT